MHNLQIHLEVFCGVSRYALYEGKIRYIPNGTPLLSGYHKELHYYARYAILGSDPSENLKAWDYIPKDSQRRIVERWVNYTSKSSEECMSYAPNPHTVLPSYENLIHVGVETVEGDHFWHLIQSDQMETFSHPKNGQKTYEFMNVRGRLLIYLKSSIEYVRLTDVPNEALNNDRYI